MTGFQLSMVLVSAKCPGPFGRRMKSLSSIRHSEGSELDQPGF